MTGHLDSLLRAAVHDARDGVCITTPEIDRPGPLILYANPALSRITGYATEELVGQSPRMLQGPKTERTVLDQIRRALARGEPFSGAAINYRKDGSPFPMQLKISPVCGEGRTPVNWIAVQRDVTRERQLEMQLLESEQKWKALLDTAPDFLMILDRGGNIQYINRTVSGLTLADVVGSSALPFIDSEYHDDFLDRIDFVFRTDQFTQSELRATGPDGSMAWYSCRFGPYLLNGTIEGVVCISTDITAKRQAEETARQHEAELARVLRISTMGEMASVLAHEINQPLTAISNYAHGCVRSLEQPHLSVDDLLEAMQRVGEQAIIAGTIVRRLKHYISKSSPHRSRTDLNKLMHEVVALVGPHAKARQAEVRLNLQEVLPLVSLDRVQIQQVIVNLLQNSFEALEGAADRHRHVEVTTEAVNGQIEIRVRDQGCGMTEEELERSFEPYYSTKENGLGMGLSISRTIVESHRGQLEAAHNEGRGMTFTLSLPSRWED